MIPVFSSSVFIYCLFMFISQAGAEKLMLFSFSALFFCSAASALVNFALARRERSLGGVAAANVCMAAGVEAACFLLPHSIEGAWYYAIAGALFLIPQAQGLMFSREPIKANTMLAFVETSICGTALVYLVQIGEFEFTGLANALCAAALAVNLAALSSLRVYGPAERRAGGGDLERGATLAAAAIALAAAAAAAAVFLLPGCRAAIFAAVAAARDLAALALAGAGRFLAFLVSLLPYSEAPADIPPPPAPYMEALAMEEFSGQIPQAAVAAVASIAAAAVIAVAAIALFRLRRLRLAAMRPTVSLRDERVGGGDPRRLPAALGRLLRALRILGRLALLRDSPEGLFLRMGFRAGRRGLKRRRAETAREYVFRVMSRVPDEAMPPGLEDIFAHVALCVDRRCFSGRPGGFERMRRNEARAILRAVGAIRPAAPVRTRPFGMSR
jgi:hypothetical protein